jgi:hypothetical protein
MERNAAIVEVNPSIRGVYWPGSWMADPALRTLSPNIAEHSGGKREIGGRAFRMDTDPVAFERAISTSRTRRAAYDAGAYTPTCYGVILHRRDLLRWYRAYIASGASSLPR